MADDATVSRIHSWIDAHREDLLRLTEALIRIPTENRETTGAEGEGQAFLAGVLREMGLEVDVFEPTEVPGLREHEAYWPGRDYRRRPNVVGVRRGAGDGRSLLFTSHMDVVAGMEGSHPPYRPVRDGDRLYGRGASDMKGGLAATVLAARCLGELGIRLRGDLILESVVDEEWGGANGTLASRLRGYEADAAISPEPNGMILSPAHRGGCMWEITVEGTPGMPFGGAELVNPAYAIAHLALAVGEWQRDRQQRVDAPPLYRDDPALPVVLSTLEARHDLVGVPPVGRLEAWVEAHPGTTLEELRESFIGHLEAAAAQSPLLRRSALQVRQRIRFLPGSEVPADHPILPVVAEAFAAARGEAPPVRGAPFACDAFVFNLHSRTPCVILGPRGGNAHAPDEWVMTEDLVALAKIYATAAVEWCGQA